MIAVSRRIVITNPLKLETDFLLETFEGSTMALSAMGPSERSEHLIYVIFPVSFSFFLLLSLNLASDVGVWVAFVSILAPLLTIVLYEIGVDEFIVKDLARRYIRCKLEKEKKRRVKDGTKRKSFKDEMERFREVIQNNSNLLTDEEIGVAIENALSSYPVRKRLWRVRATFYVIVSAIILVWIPFIPFSQPTADNSSTVLLPLITQDSMIAFADGPVLFFAGLFYTLFLAIVVLYKSEKYKALKIPVSISLIVIALVFFVELFVRGSKAYGHWPFSFLAVLEITIFSANFYRHRNLIVNVETIAAFLNLFNLISSDSVRNPEHYVGYTIVRSAVENGPEVVNEFPDQPVRWKLPAKNYLDYLDEVLVRGDWAVFLQSWKQVLQSIPQS